ncbi:MAG TPA: DedA family protein [Solirubrobacteraceae bacterium]|nr:DedA family protein [Solirubrobacteraceae bacterium]
MKSGTLVLAAVLAAGAVLRRRHLTTPVKVFAVLGVAALAVSGTGLVELPSAEQIVRTSTGALGALTYAVVGAFALAETGAFVGLVAPGEIIVVLGGVSAGHGTIALPALIAVVWACAFTGDLISYTLGRRFGRSLLLAHGAGLGVTEARVAQVERVLSAHTAKTLVLGRFVGIIRPLLPFLAGATHVPARRFVPITAGAAGMWAATFCCLGFAFWSSLDELVTVVERGSLALGAVAVAAAVAVVAWRRLRGTRQRPGPARQTS